MMHDNHDDRWAEFHRRREEWRAQHEARREEWRARHEARREVWRARRDTRRAAGGLGGHGWSMSAADWGMGAGPSEGAAALKAKLAEMEKTIAQLSERIIVLEKLATDDDARLAAEIEKLRSRDQ